MDNIAISNKNKSEGFEGQFRNLKLSDLIQMSALGNMSLVLGVTNEQDEGKIYIKDGEIIHASINNKTGIDAFYEIMSWEQGGFHTETYKAPPEETITLPWEHLLIEAHRWKDEKEAEETIADKEVQFIDSFKKHFHDYLQNWGDLHPDVTGIGLFASSDIVTIYQRNESPVSKKGLELLRVISRLSEILSDSVASENCLEVSLTGSQGTTAFIFLTPTIQIYIQFGVNIQQKAILRLEIDSLVKEMRKRLTSISSSH